MKKILLVTILLISAFNIKAQNIKTDKFELYLIDYVVNEVKIAQGMYMTENTQYFYEGEVEVVEIESNTKKSYRFYFSKWDEVLKEFLVKDLDYNILQPEFSFQDTQTILYSDTDHKVVSTTLKDTKSVDYTILSSMLVWLNSNSSEK